MITLRLSIEEAKVLETVMATVEALPADKTAHLVEVTRRLGGLMEEYHYEKDKANHD